MIYVRKLNLPSEHAEIKAIELEKRTCFHTFYPFKIFPEKKLSEVQFEGITMFYGGNGSGKSTVLNILAAKIHAIRYSEFNDAPLFDQFVQMCSVDFSRVPKRSYVLTSDDVFDYALKARSINDGIDDQRHELFENYIAVHQEAVQNPEITRFKGIDDYERWKTVMEILSPKRSQSSYIKKRVAQDIDLHSNGETALRYFLERIDEDAIYLLDEPENSLSPERQQELLKFLEDSARFFGCQFIIATHSPFLLSMKGAKIYDMDENPVDVKRWTELENVRAYYDFFKKHEHEFE